MAFKIGGILYDSNVDFSVVQRNRDQTLFLCSLMNEPKNLIAVTVYSPTLGLLDVTLKIGEKRKCEA